MPQAPIYRISRWDECFENFRTRKMKRLSWIPQKVSFEGDRIRALIHAGGASAYGAFRVLCAVAAVCKPRGTLMTGMDTPHTPRTLADKTGLAAEDFERTLALCVKLKLIELAGHSEATGDEDTHAIPVAYPRNTHTWIPPYPREGTPAPSTEQNRTERTTTAESGTAIPSEYPREGTEDAKIAAAAVSEEDAGEETKLSKVVHELRGIGMDTRAIPQLTASHSYPKILEAIAMVKTRGDGVKNRAGLVRAALDGGYDTSAGDGGKSAFEQEREADFEKSTRKREQQRKEHAQRHADHLQHLNTLAALPPGEFESIKDAAFEKIPEGMRSSIPEGTDPLEHGVWRSFMWTEYEKRNAGSQSDELIPGVC